MEPVGKIKKGRKSMVNSYFTKQKEIILTDDLFLF